MIPAGPVNRAADRISFPSLLALPSGRRLSDDCISFDLQDNESRVKIFCLDFASSTRDSICGQSVLQNQNDHKI